MGHPLPAVTPGATCNCRSSRSTVSVLGVVLVPEVVGAGPGAAVPVGGTLVRVVLGPVVVVVVLDGGTPVWLGPQSGTAAGSSWWSSAARWWWSSCSCSWWSSWWSSAAGSSSTPPHRPTGPGSRQRQRQWRR